MNDQAEQLRIQLKKERINHQAKTIAIISGKGGVGKSNFSLNFAISLAQKGKKVLLFDMDIGMGNIDILLGNTATYSIVDFFQKNTTLETIITKGPENISYISGGTGLTNLFSMSTLQFDRFMSELSNLVLDYDYIIFDLGAGISPESTKFIMCVDEIITITTPEPTSIMDAYSIIKYLHFQNGGLPIILVCNRVNTNKQGNETISRLQTTLRKFIKKEIVPLGFLPDSKAVFKAVVTQSPFMVNSPKADISIAMHQLTANYLSNTFLQQSFAKKNHFINKLKHFFIKG
ncbi:MULTISPECIES: MinD/ParA family protein [Bacillus]|uniref:MinD/ParA family protein n=1 Tax=Bacillus TaxID=1386 RepID=UPI0003196F6B|nr:MULTISPECIES: MinD/ParA family protein [Bacillus]